MAQDITRQEFDSEVLRMLTADYGISPQFSIIARGLLRDVPMKQTTPSHAALVLANATHRLLTEHGLTDEADRLCARIWRFGGELVDNGLVSRARFESAVAELPKRHEARLVTALDSSTPSRVESVRAGWVFTHYWQIYLPNKRLLQASDAERASLETPLQRLFCSPEVPLREIVWEYQAGRGSNDVLKGGLAHLPDYVFRWFRLGQVANVFATSVFRLSDTQYFDDEGLVSRTLRSCNVQRSDGDALIAATRELRTCRSPEDIPKGMALLASIEPLLCGFAMKQDNFEDLEKFALREKGVFISYSHADRSSVDELTAHLDLHEIDYWLDERELIGGRDVRESLTEAVQTSHVFLVVVSPNSISSPWVKFELELAGARSQPVVPVLIHGASARDLNSPTVCVDLTSNPEKGFEMLTRTVKALMVEMERNRPRPPPAE